MADEFDTPFRLRVLQGLTACLSGICPANGYRNDLTDAVFRGRNIFGEDDPLPMVSILEPPLAIDQLPSPESSEASSGAWELIIQGFVNDDPANPTDPAHYLMADVKAALAKERKTRGGRARNLLGMGGTVTDMFIGAGVVRPSDEVSSKAYFWLTVSLHIVETLDDPYH